MRMFFDDRQRAHAPAQELHNGGFTTYAEMPARVDAILAALGPVETPPDRGEAAILAVHSPAYVAFLKDAARLWHEAGRTGDAIPYAFPIRARRPLDLTRIDALIGAHSFDATTPITPDTWAASYGSAQSAVGAVFLLYVLGSISSAKFGTLAGRLGRRTIFWVPVVVLIAGVALTAMQPLALVIAGIAVVTIGFFGAHSIASAWVGRRAQSVAGGGARGQAAAFYLFFYYMGSSVLGSAGGFAWTHAGWPGVTGFCLVIGGVALAIGVMLRAVPPLVVEPADAPRMPVP